MNTKNVNGKLKKPIGLPESLKLICEMASIGVVKGVMSGTTYDERMAWLKWIVDRKSEILGIIEDNC